MRAVVAGPCDAVLAGSASCDAAARHPKATLAATIVGSSLAFIDSSVVNVGLPAIEHDLASSGASGASIGWLINAYLLPLGALVLLGGVAGDRFGRKRIFLAGVAIFAAASLGCALAPAFGWLLAARALQGVGAALLVPTSLALLGAAFDGEARGRAVGTWAAASAVTGAVGPLVGGWLVDTVGWRAIFLINLPVAAIAAGLAWRKVAESRSGDAAPLDVAGAALATAGLGLLTYGLTVLAARGAAAAGIDTAAGAVAIAASVACLGAFVAVEAHRKRHAMMPLALFGTRTFIGVSILTLCLYAALSGMVVLLPFLLIKRGHWAAAAAGAALLPLSIAMGLGSRAAGRLAERVGTRLLLTIGPLLVAAGFALFLRVDAGALRYAIDVLPALVLVAVGLTLSVAPLTAAVIDAVDAAHVGSASGVNNATARVAGLLATALLGWVLATDASSATFIARFHGAALVGVALAIAASASAFFLCAPVSGSRGRHGPAPTAERSGRGHRPS
ncbi:MAG TPA: MFS transporter [Caldimonas sp.]|jgi:EmrB/QacA subfamily drug resistance transporter|nr:MFS transporter [Caldimonas sp.]HEX4235824.1 MFS transporter [Caldimonas sp.]